MKLLAVDIGNTDIKFGLFINGDLKNFWRASGTNLPPEKFSTILRNSLASKGANFDALVYCSVVPGIEPAFLKTINFCYKLKYPVVHVSPRTAKIPLDIGKYPVDQLGIDRLVNACGARLLYPDRDLVIADFGTATTFDVVTAKGEYRGGAIAPGIRVFGECLSKNTARLSVVPFQKPPSVIGQNTADCLKAGITIGYRGLVREIMGQILTELNVKDLLCVATGGAAEAFIAMAADEKFFHVVEPTLTLKGLNALYQHNVNMEASTA